jgi:hypothetical protein
VVKLDKDVAKRIVMGDEALAAALGRATAREALRKSYEVVVPAQSGMIATLPTD